MIDYNAYRYRWSETNGVPMGEWHVNDSELRDWMVRMSEKVRKQCNSSEIARQHADKLDRIIRDLEAAILQQG